MNFIFTAARRAMGGTQKLAMTASLRQHCYRRAFGLYFILVNIFKVKRFRDANLIKYKPAFIGKTSLITNIYESQCKIYCNKREWFDANVQKRNHNIIGDQAVYTPETLVTLPISATRKHPRAE
jgi:hypothetical protein